MNIDIKKVSIKIARLGLFLVYFWFGILKVIGLSPASGLVQKLFESTIPVMSFQTFLILFGLFECAIGIMFIIPGLERIVLPIFFLHMATTFLPLLLLPKETWSGLFVPTLEGQYIIKNMLLISSALLIAGSV